MTSSSAATTHRQDVLRVTATWATGSKTSPGSVSHDQDEDEDQNARVVVRLVGIDAVPTVSRSRAERHAQGKAHRGEVPLEAHAELNAGGPDEDPVAPLEEQSISRVPELVPIRYGRMLASPITFYRGLR
jgi:hypothetical protein